MFAHKFKSKISQQ